MIGDRPFPAGTLFYPCLTCGGAIPEKGRDFHEQWHSDTADVAIETTERVSALEQNGAGQ